MKDPARLLENPSSDLDVLLLESGLDEPPPARIADRTLVTLGIASAAVGVGASTATAGAASIKAGTGWLGLFSGSWAVVAKVGVGVALVGGVVGGGYAVLAPPAEPLPAGQQAAQVAPDAQGFGAGVSAEGPVSQPAGGQAAPGGEAAPGAAAATPSHEEPAKVEGPSKENASAKTQGGDVAKPSVPKAAGTSKAEPEKAAAGGSLAQELKLLDAARAALRNGDKAGALAHLDAYAARFPNGQLRVDAANMRQTAKAP